MWKLRIGAVVISGALGLGSSSAAWAEGGGDSNRGDVWLDNGQPAGPGHEMDPHLACADIVVYGAGLAEGSGSFTIDGWATSGSQTVDYVGQWQVQSGSEQVALVPIRQLLMGAQASGDSATSQGVHFKLDFSQDPQEHKTFWIDCPPTTSGGGGGGGGSTSGSGGGTTPGGSGAPGGVTNTSPGPVNTPPVTSSGGPVKTSIGAVTTSRPRRPARKRHHKLVHPARHRAVHRRQVRAVSVAAPPFTG